MKHYPMRCPYCMTELKNDDILFLSDDFTSSDTTGSGRLNLNIFQSRSIPTEPIESVAGEVFQNPRNHSDNSGAQKEYYTLKDLKTMLGDKVFAKYTVVALPKRWEINNNEDNDGVLTGIDVIIDDNKYTTTRRYCPICDDKKRLDDSIGLIPFFHYAVLGDTNSGKTVYLAVINHFIKSSITLEKRNKGDISFHGMRGETEYNKNIISISGALFERNDSERMPLLPGFTAPSVIDEPFNIHGYCLRGTNIISECMIVLHDMAGETMRKESSFIKKIAYLQYMDGTIMLVDPKNLSKRMYGTLRAVETERANQFGRSATNDMSNISQSQSGERFDDIEEMQPLLSLLDKIKKRLVLNGSIEMFQSKPSIIELTKCDLLRNKGESLSDCLESNSRVICEVEGGSSYSKEYFTLMSNDTSRFIQNINTECYDHLIDLFPKPLFVPVSALGFGKSSVIKPVRIFEPILYLLMQNGYLPPYDEMEDIGIEPRHGFIYNKRHQEWKKKIEKRKARFKEWRENNIREEKWEK